MTTTASARGARRRRLLHEGTSPAGGEPHAAETRPAGEKVRYTPGDGSSSFAVATRLLPGSLASLAAVLVAGAAVAAALGWLDGLLFAQAGEGVAVASVLRLGEPGSLSAWWESLLWIAVAAQAVLLFGLRRHRTDDVGGGYRWWLFVAVVAAGMSLNAATHAHAAAAEKLAEATGWAASPAGALWWLAPALLTTVVVAARSLAEVKESRGAAVLGAGAAAMAVASGLGAASLLPTVLRPAGMIVSLLVPVLALVSLLMYSRRIVLEATGRVAPPAKAKREKTADPEAPKKQPAGEAADARSDSDGADADEPESYTPQLAVETTRRERRSKSKRAAKTRLAEDDAEESTQWVSGGEGYDDYYDEQPHSRRPSKAERKRMRRDKDRDNPRRAA